MTTIVSKRHLLKFYIALFFINLFWGLMSLATGALAEQGTTFFGKIMMVIMSAALGLMIPYTIIRYFRNVPSITVNDDSIAFNSKSYYWKDIEKIELTGKIPFKFMGEQKEGVLLKFKDKKERYIFDDMYENSDEIKSFIQAALDHVNESIDPANAFDDKQPISTPININQGKQSIMISNERSDLEQKNIEWFKGFPLYSFDGIICVGLILFFIFMSIMDYFRHHHLSVFAMIGTLCIMIYLFICYRWNYFGVSDNTLIIKNYNLFWLRQEYNLSGIREVVFELTAGRANLVRLRIIMKDFSTEKYPAATLWSKKWMQLKDKLESKGIKIRNECVHYEPFEFKFFNE